MAETRRRYDAQGRDLDVDPTLSKSDIADRQATARLSSTAGADLGGAAARARAAKPAQPDGLDEASMSPLARAAHQNRKKRGGTGADAASALAGRH